ncbi:MAG: GNAT family N-acetyltransferase [Pyrinomonadaceae bacterium]|nr:GNAT family N-acetyltransferase [Pyrinomonadaceae bacterium]MBP9109521.1 GNAT family N-acetyltransferase [Pyrinomonadaceae bacterium]
MAENIEIRECVTLDELADCVQLQRDVFALPEVELSPVRHLIVTKNAGGFTLGAYDGERLVGFVLSVPAFMRGERAFYSHMTAVHAEYQSYGIGGRLKWAQRTRALAEGVRYIKWTFEPVKSRNAYFNLEKLGAIVSEYEENFYGVDYTTAPGQEIGLASDRLFAEWHLESPKVQALAAGEKYVETRQTVARVIIMPDWFALVASDPAAALAEQIRIRGEFQAAFADGLVGTGFERDDEHPAYLLTKRNS